MDPSNPAVVIFDIGIHRLETGVPLLVASEGDEPMKSTWLTQNPNNAPAFKRLAFIYGFFVSLIIELGMYGLSQLFIMLVSLKEGESSKSTIVEQLSDVHHVLFWVHAIICVTYIIAPMLILNDMLIRFVFDLITGKEALDDEEDLDTEEDIYEAYFLLGFLTSVSIMLLLSDWLVGAVGVAASCVHAAVIISFLAIFYILITRNKQK